MPGGGISNGNTYSFQYAYNRAGSLTCESYPSGKAVGTAYDAANRVAQVAVGCVSGGNPPIGMPAYVTGTTSMAAAGGMGIQYARHGAPTSFYYGNKVVRSMSYNNRLQMAGFDDSITMQGTNPVTYVLLNASLNWYVGTATATNNGNLWGSTYTISGPGYSAPLPFTQVYMYDGENRLSNVTDQTNGTSNFTRGFLYDAFGNMWVDTTTAATTTGITPSGNTPTANVYAATGRNQINGGSYDAAGNEILVNGNNVTYDGEGRQTAVAGSGVNETYIYDADGKRVGKVGKRN